MEKQLDMLASVKENKNLCKDFESFLRNISDQVRTTANNYYSSEKSKEKFYTDCSSRIDSKISELSTKYNVEKEALRLYFSMDKKTHSTLHKFVKSNAFVSFTLEGDMFGKRNGYELNGSKLKNVYTWTKAKSVIDFFSQNADIMPESSRKYIASKSKSEQKEWNANKITNEFSRKVFERELPDKCVPDNLRSLLAKFSELELEDYVLSCHHLFTAVNNKYSGVNERGSKKIKEEILETYCELIFDEIDYCDDDNPLSSNKIISTIKSYYKKDKQTLEAVVEDTLNNRNSELPTLFFLYNCDSTKMSEIRDKVIEYISDYNEDAFDARKFSDTLKNQLFLEIEEQYQKTGNISFD